MDFLDTLVVDDLSERLFDAEWLTDILSAISADRAAKSAEVDQRVIRLRSELTDTETRLKRIYSLIEVGSAKNRCHSSQPHQVSQA